jgi:hypothetical protein
MNNINLKKIMAVFIAIFLMSRSRWIIDFFSELETGGILTLEPLRNCSEEARYCVTVLLIALCFVVIWKIYLNRK